MTKWLKDATMKEYDNIVNFKQAADKFTNKVLSDPKFAESIRVKEGVYNADGTLTSNCK